MYDNIILGAGPAGLQCAYFFEKYNISYIILERNCECGSFFSSYPHSGKLISINKKYTGSNNPEFNLRHDWNSLLTDDDFKFTDYSENLYPESKDMVTYLNDFSKKYELKIKFNVDIDKITKTSSDQYELSVKNTDLIYKCKKLIVATGLSKKIYPNINVIVNDKIKHYGDYPKGFFLQKDSLAEFKNKKVLILGGGNSGFELANLLNEVTSSLMILTKSKRDFASISHYTGDIRSIYLPFIDTFFLKSLNVIDYLNSCTNLIITQNECKKYIVSLPNPNNSPIKNIEWDNIIFCTGFGFDNSIFGFNVELTCNNKFPAINNKFESLNNNNLYFIGTLMHSRDFRISAGGVISGFRSLIKNFVYLNYNISYEVINYSLHNDLNNLVECIMYNLNNSYSMYHMFGSIGDICYINTKDHYCLYYKKVPIDVFNKPNFDENIIYFVITLEYGILKMPSIQEHGTFPKLNHSLRTTIGLENMGHLIHPVIHIYNNTHTLIDKVSFAENLFASFNDKSKYTDRIYRLFKSYLD